MGGLEEKISLPIEFSFIEKTFPAPLFLNGDFKGFFIIFFL